MFRPTQTVPATSTEPSATEYHFDVFTALHDDVKLGGDYPRVRSRVVVSALEYPSLAKASDLACVLAVTMHGGMPIACYLRI